MTDIWKKNYANKLAKPNSILFFENNKAGSWNYGFNVYH